MASSEDLYSLAYQQALAESQSAEDLALKYDAVSPYMKKLLNSVRTADVLMEGVAQHKLEKQANMDGYRKGYILFDESSDADSGTAIDAETGEAFNYRFNTFNQYDAGDKLESVLRSPSKSWNQPQFVLKMYGLQNFDGLTEEQKGALFTNVKNYHFQQMRNSLLDPDYKGEKFDPDTIYAAPTKERIEFMYKNTGGLDRYNRYLIDAINPQTGRSVVFDTAQNPYLNEKFDFYKAINSDKNIKRLERWEKQGDIISDTSFTTPTQAIENYRDNTSLLGQTYDKFDYAVDLAKSSFVGEFTKFISSDRAKKMGVDKVFDVDGWKKLDERLEKENQTGIRGQIFTAVNKEADKFYENMQKEWGKGNYFASAKNALGFLTDYIGMMPELIGQSAGQTGVGMAIGAAIGTAVAPGAGTIGGIAAGTAASILGQSAYTALSNSLDTLENYKKEHNNKEMSWDDTLHMYGEYFLAAIGDSALDRAFLGRLFGRTKLGQKMFGKPSKILEGKNSLQAGGLAALGEIPQEGWESTIDAYYSQKAEGADRQSRLELATSPEVVKQAIAGGVAGFGMGAGLTGLSRLGTGKVRKALEQDIAKHKAEYDTKTYMDTDADIDASNKLMSDLSGTSFSVKIDSINNSKISPETAHQQAEALRGVLRNPDASFSRTAYDAGMKEANQWDLAAAQYYKDKGLSNDEIEEKLGRSLNDLYGDLVQGSNLYSKRLYAEGEKLDEQQYAKEEEDLRKIGKDLGLDEEFIEKTIDSVNNDVRYGATGYNTYNERILENLNRLKHENLTPESKAEYETNIRDDLSGMLRIYSDQYYKLNSLMEGAEHLAATNERHAPTSWVYKNQPFTINRTNLANGSYADTKGVYAIFKNALQDLRDVEAKINELNKAGIPQELMQQAMDYVSHETNNPRPMAPFGRADVLEQHFNNASLSLKTQARDQSKFKGKDFNVGDLTSSLTFLTRADDKAKGSAKYNQEFQNLHYAFTQKPETVDALKAKVNGWKNEALKQKALDTINKIVAYRDSTSAETSQRKAQHDPYVKSMKATLDEIDKLYIQDEYDESGETNESRIQKLRKQAGYLDKLQKLRTGFQAVIDTNDKEDIALRDRLDKTIKEVRKKVNLFSTNRSGQETGKNKFKNSVKNFISSVKRLVDKKALETQLKSLQKQYDDGVLKGHSDQLLEDIQAKITAVQDRLTELKKQDEPKPNPKPTQTSGSASETVTEEEPEEEEDFLVQEIKKSTDINWLESTRNNLVASNPNDHRVSHYTELINKRIEEVKASDTRKPTRTAFNASYNYGEYNSLRNDPTFVALVSTIINDSSIAPNVTFKRISYFLSDEFEAKLKDKNLSEKELKKFQKELRRLTEAITEIKNSLSDKDNKEHIDKLLDKVVQKILPKLQKDYNRQVREAYKEAKNELEQSTIWRLIRGEYGRISYSSVVKVAGKSTANELRKKLPKLIVKEGGLSLDVIASSPDNDSGQAKAAFDNDPSTIVDMIYQTVVAEEKTLNGEARKQAQDSAKAEEAKLEAFKKNPKSILYGHLNRLLQAMDVRLQNMDQVISGDTRKPHENGSGSNGRGGDGNSSTTPSESDSTASQAPNSGSPAELSKGYVQHSGGAMGSDSAWTDIAKAIGLNIVSNHYYYGSRTPRGNIVLTTEQFEEGRKHVLEADKTLGRHPKKAKTIDLLARNWFQVKNSDAVYAIAERFVITPTGIKVVDGGTGWAVQMAIDNHKPVHVFNTEDGKWYYYDYTKSKFTEYPAGVVPKLTKNFAGIGSRFDKRVPKYVLPDSAKQAIRAVYKATFGNASNTPSGASQSSSNGQGVQTPTATPQGSQNGVQKPSQGSQAQPLNVWYGTGENAQFSNLAERPFTYDGRQYKSVEHAYQTLKSGSFDKETYNKAWQAGVKIRGNKGIDKKNNLTLMKKLILESFKQNENAKQALIATGTATFTHNNPSVDAFWNKEFPRLLTEVRQELSRTTNQGVTEDEAASFTPVDSIDTDFNISDKEYAELFKGRKGSRINDMSDPNTLTREQIRAQILDKKADTSEHGTESVVNNKRKSATLEILGDSITKVEGNTTTHEDEKIAFDLTSQIKMGDEEAGSYLAYDYRLYADQKRGNGTVLDSILKVANKIKLDFKNVTHIMSPTGEKIKADKIFRYFRRQTKDNEAILSKDIAFRLLYDIDPKSIDKRGNIVPNPTLNFNPYTLTLVDYTLREYLSESDILEYFTSGDLTEKQLAVLFGLDEKQLTYKQISNLREAVKKYGIPRSVLINSLGMRILNNMGIIENKETSNYGVYARLVASLGSFAVDYGQAMGLYTLTEFHPRQERLSGVLTADTIHTVKVENAHQRYMIRYAQTTYRGTIDDSDPNNKTRKANGLIQFKNPESNYNTDAVWDGSKIDYMNKDKDVYVKHSSNLTKVSDFRREVMQRQSDIVWRFDTDITDFFDDEIEIDGKKISGWEALKITMGYTPQNELDLLSYDGREAAKGVNLTIEKELKALREGIEKQKAFISGKTKDGRATTIQWTSDKDGIRFKHFWASNGRLYIDCSEMNPQTMKFLRFTLMAKGMHYTYDPSLTTSENLEDRRKWKDLVAQENFAIAQAFDMLGSTEKTNAFAEAMKELSVDQLKKIRTFLISRPGDAFTYAVEDLIKNNEGLSAIKGIGKESIPQALNAVTHLIRRKESNGKAFDTTLVAEDDSTTSGYVIKMLQMPFSEIIGDEKNFLSKVGVQEVTATTVDSIMPIHEVKKLKSFQDIYRTVAAEVSDEITDLLNPDNNIDREYAFGVEVKGDRVTGYKTAFLNKTFLLFGNALPKRNDDGTISGAFRLLMKPAVMVFGYSAGIDSISENLASMVMKEYLHAYMLLHNKYENNYEKYIDALGITDKDARKKELSKIQAINEGMKNIEAHFIPEQVNGKYETFMEALQKRQYSTIKINTALNLDPNAKLAGDKVITLQDCFNDLIGNTYGRLAGEALEKMFEPYIEANELMINMSNTMADSFIKIYKNELKVLVDTARKEHRKPTSKEVEALKEKLRGFLPTISLADDTYVQNIMKLDELTDEQTGYMALTKFDRDKNNMNIGTNYYIKDGALTQGTYAYGNELMPTYPVRAGAVVPIHCLDGSILAKVIKEFSPTENYKGIDINGVFDALITSAFVSNEVANAYNRNLFDINRDHNILKDMYDHFEAFKKKADDYQKATGIETGIQTIKDSKGNDVAQDYVPNPDGTRSVVPVSYKNFKEGYKKFRGSVEKEVKGITKVLEKLSHDRAMFYARSWAISNLDASSIRGSYLASNESELVASFAHRNARINDVVNTNIDNIPAFIEILADDPFLTEEYEQRFKVYKYTDKHIPFDQTFDNFFRDINNANNRQVDTKELASKYGENIKKLNKEISKESKKQGSSPNSYQTNGAINNIYSKALDDPEERANIVDYVQNLAASLGNKLCSDKHVARLKELVRSIAPERIKGVALDIADNGRWTAGEYDPVKKHIQLVMDNKSATRLLDSKTKLCVLSLLAPAEIYAHEVLHAGNEFAFTHRGVFGFNSQIRKLLVIQEEAKKVLSWEDFMPADGTFDESLRPYYEKHARDFFDYIFVEKDPKTLASLNEFCSFVATNENLRAKLSSVTINQPTMNPNANLVDRLVAILKGIYDVLFSKKKFSEVFTRTYKVLKGDSTGKTVSLLDEFDRLHRQLHTANHKAINPLFAQPMKYFETFLAVTDELIKSGNEKIHGYLHKMFNFHEIKRDEALAKAQEARQQNDDDKEKAYIKEASKHIPKVNIATNATKWEITKELGKLAKTIVTSSEARKNMRMIMRDLTRVSQQGLWMSTYRDFMGADEGTSMFEALGMRLRMVDKISKNQEATAMKVLQDAFGRPLNDYENTALANAFLYTDAQSLYDGQNLGKVVDLLKDKKLRTQNITKILDSFKKKLSPRDYTWLQYSAISTAYHMVNSVGNPLLNLNAKNIAEGKGWDHSLNLSEDEINQLDKLITLYAIDNTSQEFLDVTATLPTKGIEQFLKMHQEFVNETKHGYKNVSDSGQIVVTPFIEAMNIMKGYTKTMTDPSIESVITVPDATDPEAMKKQGYDDKMTIRADNIVNGKDTHVYTRFGIPNRRDGNTVSVQGHHAMGKTLMQFAFSEEDELDIKNGLQRTDESRKREALRRWKAMRKKADDHLVNLRKEIIATSKNGKEFTFDDMNKLIDKYSSFSPIYNDKVAGPTDYRQTLARDIKRQHLGLDERGLTILSRMFGSVTRQIYGASANEVLLKFTEKYMKDNMNFMTNMDMQGHKFVKIEKDSPNKYLRESWKVIPQNFKDYAKTKNLYIREDWLQDYFGVSNYTLLDNEKVKKHTGYLIKRGIAIAEMIMKTIAYARKQAIVLKIPGVLVGNIVSNLMFSIMNHRNPFKVIKTTIANAQAIRDYIENRKVLDRILFKTRLGTVTKEETDQIPALRRKLENNIVKPLMEKGMYQSIIEDMQSDELESIGKVNKWLKHNKIAQKLPAGIKNTFKTIFMMEGTPAYDFMFIATQYSDFVARCTEYQLSMDEVPAEYERAKKKGTTKETLSQFMARREKEISTMITNAFINYDKPQSKFEQYMNDLGLLMFSKFGKRIQSVIKNQLYHRPIHALLFLMSQLTFIDTEDILEQNLFSKNWLNLMHSPIENFIGAAVPMPIQILFGDQKAF